MNSDASSQAPPSDMKSSSDSQSGYLAPREEARGDRGNKKDIGEIFSQAMKIYSDNPILIVPSLIPISAFILGMLIFAGYMGLMAIFADGGFFALSLLSSLLMFVILMVVLLFLAEGASIEMIREASMGKAADLSSAWRATRSNLEPLVLTSLLAGIIIASGYGLFFVPGLILSFALYFVSQAVMIEGRSGLDALKASYRFVEANLSDSLIVALASLAISAVLHSVPVIGPLLVLLSLPYIYALATLLYIERRRMPESSQKNQERDVEIS